MGGVWLAIMVWTKALGLSVHYYMYIRWGGQAHAELDSIRANVMYSTSVEMAVKSKRDGIDDLFQLAGRLNEIVMLDCMQYTVDDSKPRLPPKSSSG